MNSMNQHFASVFHSYLKIVQLWRFDFLYITNGAIHIMIDCPSSKNILFKLEKYANKSFN